MKLKGDFIRELLTITSTIIPSIFLIAPLKNILLPTYHVVSEDELPHIKHLYKYKNPNQFKKDLEFILKYYQPIDLKTLHDLVIKKEKVNKRYFHLSFDDGLRECYEVIRPILIEKGIPATFFINPSFIDNKDLMHRYKVSLMIEDIKTNDQKKLRVSNFIKRKLGIRRDPSSFLLTLRYSHSRFIDEVSSLTETDFSKFLINQKPYLTTNQINHLIKDRFSIGAHSMTHPEYFMLSEEEQLRQTIDSINFIKEEFNPSYNAFAFPFTDNKISKKLFSTIFDSHPPYADLTFGVAGLKNETYFHHLQRVPMEKKYSGDKIIKGEYLYYYLKSIFRKNIINRK